MDFDLIVVGGGLAGASLVASLRSSRLRIGLIERRPPVDVTGWDSRIYAISPANVGFLSSIGVWQHLPSDRLTPIHAMEVRGDAGGKLEFSAYDSGLPELAWTVESGRVHRELWETVRRQHNVTLIDARPERLFIDGSGAAIDFASGARARAKLIVGADGVESWVREQAEIEATAKPYGEMGVVANFRCERPHRNIAYQWFREDGILAYLPLPDGLISIVWSTAEEHARSLLALDVEDFCRRVAAAGENVLGRLALETPPAAFPLRLMRVDTVVKPRVALIGDAAHAIHPLSGHGINLGFQDVKALTEILQALPQWRDPGDLAVLRRYARARAEEPFLLQYATHGLNRLFGTRNPLVAQLRNVGLNLTNSVPVVRNALVRYAAAGKL